MTLKRQSPWLALYTASSTVPDRSEIGPYLGSHWASSRESCHKLSLTVGTGRILLMFLRSVLGVSEAFGEVDGGTPSLPLPGGQNCNDRPAYTLRPTAGSMPLARTRDQY